MRIFLPVATALAVVACNAEAPAPPAPAAPVEAAAPETPATAAMDDAMKSADAADDASTAETPDNYMFHTDTTKIESVHLPLTPGASWTATVIDPTQAELTGAADETMPDGSVHHVVKVKLLKRDVIARVKFERRDGAEPTAPVVETRTINFMVH